MLSINFMFIPAMHIIDIITYIIKNEMIYLSLYRLQSVSTSVFDTTYIFINSLSDAGGNRISSHSILVYQVNAFNLELKHYFFYL